MILKFKLRILFPNQKFIELVSDAPNGNFNCQTQIKKILIVYES